MNSSILKTSSEFSNIFFIKEELVVSILFNFVSNAQIYEKNNWCLKVRINFFPAPEKLNKYEVINPLVLIEFIVFAR